MSVGNLKTYGGKGTNMPWQSKMLIGLEQIIAASGGGGGGIAPQLRTPTMFRTTSALPAIAAGKKSVSISNVGSTDGTVLGAILKPGETVNFDAGAVNNTLSVITYDATETEFLVIHLV